MSLDEMFVYKMSVDKKFYSHNCLKTKLFFDKMSGFDVLMTKNVLLKTAES